MNETSALQELFGIARAMTTERDVERLLAVILEKSRLITSADAGSIYVVEGDGSSAKLRFKLTQNHSVSFDSREFTMPISNRSIAGSCVINKKAISIPDVYHLPPGSPFQFDRTFDQRIGYVTRSMMTVPLISQREEVLGVIQLINRKKDGNAKLLTKDDVDREVIPFDDQSEELLLMVAAQAGVSLENATLYDEIRLLFEGFVRASVDAIESRDPTTSGHSRRVADLTVGLAQVVDAESSGPYKGLRFSKEQLRELEYASLLHDFGKIGVRERVLVKAKKLFDEQLELIRSRFDYVARTLEAESLAERIKLIESGASKEDLARAERRYSEQTAELDVFFASVLSANEPAVLAGGDFAKLEKLAGQTYRDRQGNAHPLLQPGEFEALRILRGSLTSEEIEEIRSHVTHTYRFLSKIPWGKTLRGVPEIAGSHHEKLDGTGYPNRLPSGEIPVQSKMMSIADIFDALTASDRPYKKAVPIDRALDILDFSVKDGHLDADLTRVFRGARVWEIKPAPRGSARPPKL